MQLDIRFTKSVMTFYDEMVTQGISLVYLGEFSQEITNMFTQMTEGKMETEEHSRAVKRKVYHCLVEVLQNMNKHSDEFSGRKDIGAGLFMIGKDEECYYLMTANKIEKTKVNQLKENLDFLNASSEEELKKMYMKQIKEGTISIKGGAGLGLIDIARKTKQKYKYQFLPADGEFDFFVLKIDIKFD